MNTEKRKVFNLEDQKVKDILAAIKTITPVISLISVWGKKERAYEEVSDDVKKVSKDIKILRDAAKILSDQQAKELLSKTEREKYDLYQALSQKEEILKRECKELEDEVNAYVNYAKKWVGITKNTIDRLISLNSYTKYDDAMALLFFAHITTDYTSIERRKIIRYLSINGQDPGVIEVGWNKFINYLKHQ